MNTTKIIYYVSTGLVTVLMLFSAGMYILNHAEIVKIFQHLSYPIYIIYPLAIAKILGVIAIWSNYNKTLKEWAYAGFFFDFILAWSAHYFADDGALNLAIAAIIILIISYVSYKKMTDVEK